MPMRILQSRLVAWAEEEDVGGFAIQGMRPEGTSADTSIQLNRERVASIEVDTAEVAVLLSDVFVDEQDDSEVPQPATLTTEENEVMGSRADSDGDGQDGLDAAHQALPRPAAGNSGTFPAKCSMRLRGPAI